jgi:putative hydrolase of the HAD superfamily
VRAGVLYGHTNGIDFLYGNHRYIAIQGNMITELRSTISRKTAVLFDLFHTLTDLESTWSRGPMTHEILGLTKEDWNTQLLECSRDRLVGKMTDPHQIIRWMAHAINPVISEDLIARATENRIKRFAAALVHIPPTTVAVLTALRRAGKQLALISNADMMEVRAWEQSPIADLFHVTLFSCHVGCVKPEPEIYSLCLRQLDACPHECMFVGDGGSHELEGARACGITTVMVTGIIKELWPDRIEGRKAHADFVIEHLSDLLPTDQGLHSNRPGATP